MGESLHGSGISHGCVRDSSALLQQIHMLFYTFRCPMIHKGPRAPSTGTQMPPMPNCSSTAKRREHRQSSLSKEQHGAMLHSKLVCMFHHTMLVGCSRVAMGLTTEQWDALGHSPRAVWQIRSLCRGPHLTFHPFLIPHCCPKC